MRNYEILTILPGTLAETEVSPVVEQMKELIQKEGVKGLEVESGGKSRLAYPMKHIRYGYFHVFTFEAEPKEINEIEKKFRLFGQVLRTIIHTFDPSKRETGKTMISMLGIDEEREEKKEETVEKAPVAEKVVAPVAAPVEEVKVAAQSEEKAPEVNMQEFDKQLEAILDDKIAGL
jgi:small subunit ribosomal protein S6